MYPTPNELSSYSPAWPCAHFRLAGGVNALAGVLLTIRLRAGDFYAVIVDEGEARINYHRIESDSE